MKLFKKAVAFLCVAALVSCEGYEIFEKELYEKIVYVLTKDDNKVFSEVHSLDEPISIGHVSVLMSGSVEITEPILVEFEYDDEALDIYNEKMFGVDESKFIDPLPTARYEIPTMSVTVSPDDLPARGLLEIKIKPEGLSPDSTYLIPLKIKSSTADKISETNKSVMYQVYIKNEYANQKERTLYSMRGEKTEPGKNPYAILTNKTVLPLTKNKIRTTIDQRAFEAKVDKINKDCMVIEIKGDKSLDITPFNSDYLDIELVAKEGYNQYRPDVVGAYRFYLSYRYRTRSSAEGNWSNWTTISENLLRYAE